MTEHTTGGALSRRSLVTGAAGLSILGVAGIELASAQPAAATGGNGHTPSGARAALVPPGGGERLTRRWGYPLTIAADPVTTGAKQLTVGPETLAPGLGIPKHRHHTEEVIIVLAGRTEAKLAVIASDFQPSRVMTVVTDVSDPAQVRHLIDATVERFGGIDVLINNAGTGWEGDIQDQSAPEDWARVFSANTDSVFYLSRSALPHLIARRGSIVNVSSVTGLGGDWGMSIYKASKGAVSNFTRGLALDLEQHGVRVNAVLSDLCGHRYVPVRHRPARASGQVRRPHPAGKGWPSGRHRRRHHLPRQ